MRRHVVCYVSRLPRLTEIYESFLERLHPPLELVDELLLSIDDVAHLRERAILVGEAHLELDDACFWIGRGSHRGSILHGRQGDVARCRETRSNATPGGEPSWNVTG